MSDNSRGFANLEKFYSKPVSSFLHNHVVQVWHVGVQEELDELKIKKREVKEASVLKIDRTIVATGCFVDNHITRIYVLPEHQKRICTFIMKNIEVQISEKYDKEYLDASLPAAALYEKLGFSTVKHECYPVENGVILAYEVKKAYIMNMYTAPEYRRQGIAIHTLDLLVKDVRKQGVSQIALETTEMGRPLYEKYGFVKIEDEMELIK